MRAIIKLFLIMYAPLALILTMLFYAIYQIDQALRRSLFEIHSLSHTTVLLHLLVYYAVSLLLLFIVVSYLAVVMASNKKAVYALSQSNKQFMGLYMLDITVRNGYEAKIRELAYHDVLTGLPNRQLLLDRISRGFAQTERAESLLAILFLDLDKFKQINDTLGHDVGDELLKTIAVRVSASVRGTDTVSRTGGDEFTIVLPDINTRSDVEKVAQKILDGINGFLDVKGHQLEVLASIGIALYPSDGDNVVELMKKADMAMYTAKEAGGNCYRFYKVS